MHVGLGLCFQSLDAKMSDADIYRLELGLAARAEASGFDSIWTPEHHFSDYQMTPNVQQFLAWVAGQTSRIRLGTMAVVLPMHNPVRVAEEAAGAALFRTFGTSFPGDRLVRGVAATRSTMSSTERIAPDSPMTGPAWRRASSPRNRSRS